MYSLIALLLALTAHSAISEDNEYKDNPATGSVNFDYYTKEPKEKADELLKFLTDLDDAINDELEKLKTYNNVSLALKQYNEAVESVKGTNCSYNFGGNFDDVQEKVDASIKECKAFAPNEDRNNLKNKITEGLTKDQQLDNEYKHIDLACPSLRIPANFSCEITKKTILNDLQNLLSYEKTTELQNYSNIAFFNAIAFIKSCINVNNEDVLHELEAITDVIEDCASD